MLTVALIVLTLIFMCIAVLIGKAIEFFKK